MRRLLLRLIHYQKRARPVWFPERDPTANPSSGMTIGFWGPWMSSTANKAILEDVLSTIPPAGKKKICKNCKRNEKKIEKVCSTHGESDKEVSQMLEKILEMANEGKKGNIPRNSRLMKESLAMLYAKMKQKTKVDDLMHKLQMIKKGRVAKKRGRKGRKSGKRDKESIRTTTLDHINSLPKSKKSKKVMDKTNNVDKVGTRRTKIEDVAEDDTSSKNEYGFKGLLEKNSNSREEDQNMEEISSLVKSSGAKDIRQNDTESDDLMADSTENDISNDNQIEDEGPGRESSDQSADASEETSEEGSGRESQSFTDVSDDVNDNNDDFTWDDKINTAWYL